MRKSVTELYFRFNCILSTEMEHLTKHFIYSADPILNLEQEDGLRKKADADFASKVKLIQIQEH